MSNAEIVLNVFVHETRSINLTLGAPLCALRRKCIGFCLHFPSLESIVFIFTLTHTRYKRQPCMLLQNYYYTPFNS